MKNNIVDLFSVDEPLTQNLKKWHKQPWRTYYSLFVAKEKRKLQKKQANFQQKKHVAKLWNIFLEQYFQEKLEYFELKAKKDFSHQKIIWQYWGQGTQPDQLPTLVKLCFASVDKFKQDYQVIRLDEQSVREYLDLPDFVWEKKKNPQFKPAFFADLIRLALLDVYGGVWIDATVLLTGPLEQELLEQDFFMFHRSKDAPNQAFWENFNGDYFGWHDQHYVNVLNSFIIGKKQNKLIHICLDIMLNYWKTQSNIPHYFIFQIMFNELIENFINIKPMLIKDDTVVHLLQVKQNQEFSLKDFKEITLKSHIHKLNYITSFIDGSYYDYLLKNHKL